MADTTRYFLCSKGRNKILSGFLYLKGVLLHINNEQPDTYPGF